MKSESSKFILHLIIAIGGGLATFFCLWDSWLSLTCIDMQTNLATINQKLIDIDTKVSTPLMHTEMIDISTTTANIDP